MRLVLGVLPGMLLAVLVAACKPDAEISTAGLALRTLPSCPIDVEGELSLGAAGDFPTQQQEISSAQTGSIDAFPLHTRWLSIEADAGEGAAGSLVAMRGETFARSALMLPIGTSCPLGDPLAAAPMGAALAALPEGGLLVAGGRDDSGAASSIARLLLPGEALATQVEGGMLLRRSGATATRLGTQVIVAGGAPDERGPAHETYEVFDLASQRFDPALSEKLTTQRRDHGAARLPDGSLLLVGGRGEVDGAALASAERILPEGGPARAVDMELEQARIAPAVMVLDSGEVLIAAGHGADGLPVAAIERFEPETERFETVAQLDVSRPINLVVALEGNRLAHLGCRSEGGCALSLVLPRSTGYLIVKTVPLDVSTSTAVGLAGLTDPQMLALPDGRLLLLANRADGNVAMRIDPARQNIEMLDVSRRAERLVQLEDGTVVELDTFGSSLRRLDLRSRLHDPPALNPGQASDGGGAISLDAPGRFEHMSRALRASTPDSRLDLTGAHFDDVRIELTLDGEGSVLLERRHGEALAVAVAGERVALGDCSAERDGNDITIERRGTELRLSAGGSVRRCDDDGLLGYLEVAVVLQSGARLLELSTLRL